MLVNMKEILEKAKEGKYAVGLFNAVNVEMA
ncbi:MAG: class II fructose-bisphosphate aldolase, partial [Oscillospiraceae bacterium]|nr:class II fructose-bisphosphate aldolase [Oscillospiraceae bacterium]